MDIRYAKKDYFDIDGDGVFRLLPEHLDRLDLLIRESIQNSLDAAIPETREVRVDMFEDTFDNNALADILPQLDLQFFKNRTDCKYLALRDSGTEGLTGTPFTNSNNIGRFQKLVFSITKAQDQKGAGGSHGIGKTIFFKLGIGLVFFYSRIKNKDGSYESRLIANYIEDIKSGKKPRLKTTADQRHIAWWGVLQENNEILPITDENEIQSILAGFNNFKLYQGEETGTTIIIPYFKGNELLNLEKNPILKDTETYISCAVQKWYAPRLNNQHIRQHLKCTYNGETIKLSEPFFIKLQSLYNIALGTVTEIPSDVYCEKIKVRRMGLLGDTIGSLAYCKINEKSLGMQPPFNCSSPAEILANKRGRATMNEPLVAYCRKPGMIISYSDKEWVKGVEETTQSQFIIGFFVLNSDAKFKSDAVNGKVSEVEEYLRMCELSDHYGWQDATNPEFKSTIVKNMKKAVSMQIKNTFCDDDTLPMESVNKAIGRKIAAAILPPENISSKYIAVGGTGGGHGVGGTGTKKIDSVATGFRTSKVKGSYEIIEVNYKNNNLVQAKLTATVPAEKAFSLTLAVDADGEKLTNAVWEMQFGKNTFPLTFFQVSATEVKSLETGKSVFKGDRSAAVGKTETIENVVAIELTSYELSILSKEAIRIELSALFRNTQFVYSTFIATTEESDS